MPPRLGNASSVVGGSAPYLGPAGTFFELGNTNEFDYTSNAPKQVSFRTMNEIMFLAGSACRIGAGRNRLRSFREPWNPVSTKS